MLIVLLSKSSTLGQFWDTTQEAFYGEMVQATRHSLLRCARHSLHRLPMLLSLNFNELLMCCCGNSEPSPAKESMISSPPPLFGTNKRWLHHQSTEITNCECAVSFMSTPVITCMAAHRSTHSHRMLPSLLLQHRLPSTPPEGSVSLVRCTWLAAT